ncbi:D-alanyl-D-alanine carboxypeptidase/D-alanyl-D-alanine-endopeptidase [Ancylomarina sp. DW003]|nr:D-alanyl-D-alanine carboxypeptidase/D-alanyl-D-alanine-endopeptidase [Ancylomarina sp. DW003]MDE5424171.1 D-alanyl-D-alanine carboxypeptidase/D-alanyl-D-alanine-endopeptidase [Ancylomarina sp. DW003]
MTQFISKYCLFIYLLLTSVSVFAQKPKDQKVIDDFVNQDIFKSASIGIEVCDLETGQVLASYQSEKSLTPASTQKLITTASALEILGADFQFKTDVYITGRIDENGNLMGNLIVRGFGDPTLSSKYFPENIHFISSFYKAFKQQGIKQINGKFIIDDSYYQSSIPRTWIWEDIGNYYGAVPHSLSYKDNTYTLHFESKEAGQLTQISKISNKQDDLKFLNKVTSSTINRDRAYIFGGTTSEQRIVEGTIPQNRSDFKVKGAVSNPSMVLRTELEKILNAGNIDIKGGDYRTKTQKTILEYKSPQLSDIVALTNQKSINLFADHLLFEIGAHQKKEGNWKTGIDAIKEFWQSKGIDSEGLFLHDGSGLSHFNAISVHSLNQILIHMNKSENSDAFFNSLPIAGKNGTLKNFGKQSLLASKFKAKTGSMMGVRSYSGVLTKSNGKQIAISFIINNYTCSSRDISTQFKNLLIRISK